MIPLKPVTFKYLDSTTRCRPHASYLRKKHAYEDINPNNLK